MKETFPEGKSDLFAAFIERCLTLLRPHGFMAQVTMQSWMFLSSFEKLRNKLRRCASIVAMLHMDNMVMRIAFGTSATVWEVGGDPTHPGKYTWMELSDIEGDKPRVFPAHNERNARAGDDGFFSVAQKDMAVIPGSPIVYWLSEKMRSVFSTNPTLGESASLAVGLQTGDNNRFLREWWEVSIPRIAFACTSREDAAQSGARWFPYNKGGDFRKWYGNQEFVVNWENDGAEIFNFRPRSVVRNPSTYFSPSVSWSDISSSEAAFRAFPNGFIHDVKGMSAFAGEDLREKLVLLMNSLIVKNILKALAPTINFQIGDVGKIPIPEELLIEELSATALISKAKQDWDSFENSWDFGSNPLVAISYK
ncbi:Eco57I restriction-modification methylase domain-containing protein [Schaalia hyovaginalis]|uniref:Eco57I restriction-modification methylase domain-containing protein n=1 Tax=Schaalia hyovaginalis TaxID=29316 RepID=UPI002A74B08D|nr:hypothetical protein [Schaalia hyovaginalis]MDY2668993.1 hypothetical protein [Schaalia hyovaginalis]